MRALCNDRGIAAVKGVPVHMMEWHDIIKALEDENSKIAQWPKALGQIKVQAQEFYNGATAQFTGSQRRMEKSRLAHSDRLQ